MENIVTDLPLIKNKTSKTLKAANVIRVKINYKLHPGLIRGRIDYKNEDCSHVSKNIIDPNFLEESSKKISLVSLLKFNLCFIFGSTADSLHLMHFFIIAKSELVNFRQT